MPDITLCKNDMCPLKGQCYRFMTTPSPRGQSYAYFAPNTEGGCEYFIPLDATITWEEYIEVLVKSFKTTL